MHPGTIARMIYVVFAANVAVYLLMTSQTGTFSWGAYELFDWGANMGEASLHGQPWRLFTAMFLHAGFQHIFGNMVLLLITGAIVERKIGSARFIAVYLASGLAGSLLTAFLHPQIVAIGASGAIAGLLGALVTLKLTARAPEVSGAWMWQVIGVNALYSFAPNVDGLAHLGGFIGGLVFGGLAGMHLPKADLAEIE